MELHQRSLSLSVQPHHQHKFGMFYKLSSTAPAGPPIAWASKTGALSVVLPGLAGPDCNAIICYNPGAVQG